MRVELPSLPELSPDDLTALLEPVDASVEKARAQGRIALADLFAGVAMALRSSANEVVLEALADLDGEELEAVSEGLEVKATREVALGHTRRAALYVDLRAGVEDERRRRVDVLAALDRAMAWYEAHLKR
jgi:hypothetical protein